VKSFIPFWDANGETFGSCSNMQVDLPNFAVERTRFARRSPQRCADTRGPQYGMIRAELRPIPAFVLILADLALEGGACHGRALLAWEGSL